MVENKSSLQGCNRFNCCLVYSGNLGKVSKTYLRNPSEKSPLCIIFFLSRKKLTDFGGTPPPFPPTLRTDSTKKLLAMDRPKLKMMIENGSKDSILSNQSPNSFSIYPLNGKICDCYLLHERSRTFLLHLNLRPALDLRLRKVNLLQSCNMQDIEILWFNLVGIALNSKHPVSEQAHCGQDMY